MSKKDDFLKEIETGYTYKGDFLTLGAAMLDNETMTGAHIKVPLKTLNRHGLIAGATGTGKTKSLQVMAEALSEKGVPVLLMDIKGDLSGLGQPSEGHPKIDERMEKIGHPWDNMAYPLELLSISEQEGVRMRATVSEFGPVLISRILNLNETQSGIVSLIFKYCDDNQLPLLDLKDLKKTIQFITNEGKEAVQAEYGRVSTASTGAILRKIIELEQQGAELFFGEKSFDTDDLLRIDEVGRGMINILRLTDIQDRPKLFSTFMLCLMAEIYSTFPEEGDLDQPKLVIFIDEAHLLFEEASKALHDQIETMAKLIRSKGVGLFFCTQNPDDIPDDVLSQLGLKVQHALRAFTAKDRKKIKLAAENFPLSDYYDVDQLLTELGIGEALVTVLNEKGIPTPLAACMMCAPKSRMDVLSAGELEYILESSSLAQEYNKDIDRNSAYEILTGKIKEVQDEEEQARLQKEADKVEAMRQKKTAKSSKSRSRGSSGSRSRSQKSTLEKVINSSVGRTVAREVTRGILGVLGLKTTRSRRKKSSWF